MDLISLSAAPISSLLFDRYRGSGPRGKPLQGRGDGRESRLTGRARSITAAPVRIARTPGTLPAKQPHPALMHLRAAVFRDELLELIAQGDQASASRQGAAASPPGRSSWRARGPGPVCAGSGRCRVELRMRLLDLPEGRRNLLRRRVVVIPFAEPALVWRAAVTPCPAAASRRQGLGPLQVIDDPWRDSGCSSRSVDLLDLCGRLADAELGMTVSPASTSARIRSPDTASSRWSWCISPLRGAGVAKEAWAALQTCQMTMALAYPKSRTRKSPTGYFGRWKISNKNAAISFDR